MPHHGRNHGSSSDCLRYVILLLTLRMTLTGYRERTSHSGTPHSSRFSTHDWHRIHRVGFHLLHKPARAGSIQGFQAKLVVLAPHDRTWTWCDCLHEVGWTFHHRLGWILDCCPALGPPRRLQERHPKAHDQAHPSQSLLLDRHPSRFLHGNVRHSLPLPCQPR